MTIYTPTWLSKLQDFFAVPVSWCKPIASIQWGWGTRKWPNPLTLKITVAYDNPSLYMNGILFASIRLPFFVNLMIRWNDDKVRYFPDFVRRLLRKDAPITVPAYVQTHIGWRPIDGRPVAVIRFQSDQSAQGGLAMGFSDGGK